MSERGAVVPPKLGPGLQVRVVAPARSLAIIGADARAIASARLGALGLDLSFGAHVEVCDDFKSSSVEDRVADLHAAFADPEVDGLLTVIGGFNSNQLLSRLDFELVRDHPRPLCGFSDITALSNSIWARTGVVGYSGPHYSSFGMRDHFDYTEAGFRACLFGREPIELRPAPAWSDDLWFLDQDNRREEANDGWWVLNEGEAEGTIVGGNLCTFNLLQGTSYMPALEGTVVLIEDDEQVGPWDFDRDLVSLIQQPGFGDVRAVVIGRFQRVSEMTRDLLVQIVASKPELARVPVVANVDFGHTTPIFTFPIGGTMAVVAAREAPRLTITRH